MALRYVNLIPSGYTDARKIAVFDVSKSYYGPTTNEDRSLVSYSSAITSSTRFTFEGTNKSVQLSVGYSAANQLDVKFNNGNGDVTFISVPGAPTNGYYFIGINNNVPALFKYVTSVGYSLTPLCPAGIMSSNMTIYNSTESSVNTELIELLRGDTGNTISYSGVINGTISGSSTAYSGDTVTITVTPDTGYVLSSIAIYKTASQDPVNYTKVNDTTYTFVMPDADVTVTGIFVRAYTISYGCVPFSAGTITGTESPSVPGAEITFTVSSNSNFIVSSVSVNAGQTELEWNSETGIGRFIMPERNTYVTVTLVTKDDPNEQGGTSEPEIPDGTFDDNSSTIPIPSTPSTGISYDVPTGQGVGKGLVTIYNPTLEELKDLGNYLYANSVTEAIWNGLRNIFANPMDAIISLHVLPFTPTRGVNKHAIALGPLNSQIDSYIVSEQYKDVNMGTLRFQPYWDSYLDYAPYTKISLFLPYIGSVELNPDIVMGKLVGIRYRCDVLTGGCVAYLFTYEGEAGSTVESVFGEYSGSMALSLPLAGSDFAQIISGFISAVSSVAIMKGAGSGALVTNANEGVDFARQQLASAHASRGEAYAIPKTIRGAGGRFASNAEIRNEAINSANSAYENAKEALQMARGQQRGVLALAAATNIATVPYTVGRVMGSKVNTTISGTITGGLGLLGSQKPYVIITRPRQSLATNYKHFVGYPSNITARLNTLSGYTKVEKVELKSVPCTDTELAMLYEALKEGSYL